MRRINPMLYGALAIAVFLGIVFAAQHAGFWSTDRRVAVGARTPADPTDVESIRGWMTLADISKTYNAPVAEILAAFNLPEDTPPTATLRSLRETHAAFEVGDLREWLHERMRR